MYVWKTPEVPVPIGAAIALGPVAGDVSLSQAMEQALLTQRPAVCSHLAVFTPQQLATMHPMRLASTASINHDATALVAARTVGADVLVMGEISRTDMMAQDLVETPKAEPQNANQVGLQRLLSRSGKDEKRHHLLITWRFLDVATGNHLGAQHFNMDSRQVSQEYPDLEADTNPATRLISAAARETWKGVAPVVTRTSVQLAGPGLQPGGFWVWRGNRAAKKGDWPLAERRWRATSKWFWFNAPARHNLALAKAAQGDFTEAKQILRKAHGPLSVLLPNETLFWLDQHHRDYHAAHGLGEPAEGWAIPRSDEVQFSVATAPPIDVDQLPWWTAIPLMKPSELTWQQYWTLW